MMIKTRYPQRGAMLITMSFFFIMLIGFAAVAVDVGHLMIARNELQNAADAAALAGANCLNKKPKSSGLDCEKYSSESNMPNWTVAANKAFSFIGENKADGATLGAGVTQLETVTTGYKNVMDPLSEPTALAPSTLSPVTCDTTAGPCYKPAVMVRLQKKAGQNGGPVQTLITSMFGGTAVPITATAVAVISSPGNVTKGILIPQAINQCMFDRYWDSATNSPKLATYSPLKVTVRTVDNKGNPSEKTIDIVQDIGQPWELIIGSAYHYDTCGSGQWTTFDLNVNDVPAIRDLITNNNPNPIRIGDNTWIEPGTKTTLYGDLDDKYPTPLSPPTANTSPLLDVTLPVVNLSSSLDNKGQTPIVAFAGFHITDIQGGSDKYIQGHFTSGTITNGSSGIGPSYGTYTPARLAQ
jgi:Flp pilus assembly protein TadG